MHLALALAAAPQDAHASHAAAAWTWTLDPVVLTLLAASAMIYGIGVRGSRGVRRWHVVSFYAGLATIFAAQISPLDALSDALFSAHMGQHELLVLIAAPLLVFGQPLAPMLRGLPPRLREGVLHAMRRPRAVRAWQVLSHPLHVFLLHAVVILGWHVPLFYQTAIRNEPLHLVQHAMFLGTAVLFWWALAHGRYGRLGYGMAAVFVFITAMYSGALGALITFAPRLWYPIYDAPARAMAIDPLADQQVAGLIMWVPAGALLVVVGVAFFAAWLGALERRTAAMLALVLLLPVTAVSCARSEAQTTAAAITGGQPERGAAAIRKYGCDACHTIPGVRGANAVVGPSLERLGARTYVRHLPNTPENLMRWIRHPKQVRPETPMPDTGVTEEDARHIAAYLYTLR